MAACLAMTAIEVSPARAEVELSGFVELEAALSDGVRSWRDGGFGRLDSSADPNEGSSFEGSASLHLRVDWRPDAVLGAYLHATARDDSENRAGREIGAVEAYLRADIPLREVDVLRFRLGHFLLPTSRENVDPGWQSPYTLTLSAINTWIGQEIRPTGLLADYTLGLGHDSRLRLGGTAFGGNDTAGALLAWRGWGLGHRLSVFGESLPLPPVRSLLPGGTFADLQNLAGTTPFDRDFDDRLGWAGYVRASRPGKILAQLTRFDNRGDRQLHGNEYAWYTDFNLAAIEVHPSERFTVAAEYLSGETSMGAFVGPRVEAEMEAAYLLASFEVAPLRLSLRYDDFTVRDLDLSAAEDNNGDGRAWTLAVIWQGPRGLRLGVEYLDLDSHRGSASEVGIDPQTDARSLTFELRYTFGP